LFFVSDEELRRVFVLRAVCVLLSLSLSLWCILSVFWSKKRAREAEKKNVKDEKKREERI